MTPEKFFFYYFKLATFNRDANYFAQECGYKSAMTIPKDDLETFIELFREWKRSLRS